MPERFRRDGRPIFQRTAARRGRLAPPANRWGEASRRAAHKTRKVQAMSKIKTTKQFKEQVDAAFATMHTRDEAKAA